MGETAIQRRIVPTDFQKLHAQINPDPVHELSRRLQMWASVPDADGGALTPSAAIVPDETIIAALNQITRLTSERDILIEALRFYADEDNHGHPGAVEGDNGYRARKALAAIEKVGK